MCDQNCEKILYQVSVVETVFTFSNLICTYYNYRRIKRMERLFINPYLEDLHSGSQQTHTQKYRSIDSWIGR